MGENELSLDKVPINAQFITKIDDKTVTLADQTGVETPVGLPSLTEKIEMSKLEELVNSEDPMSVIKASYAQSNDEEKRGMLLLMLRYVDWASVEPYLLPSERVGTEEVLNYDTQANRSEFRKFLTEEMILDV